MRKEIVLIDYGLGNIRSLVNAFHLLDVNVIVSNDIEVIKSSKVIVLPGVGAYEDAMKSLISLGLSDLIVSLVKNGDVKILGICLGMQLLAGYSTENGFHSGLGLIPGYVDKLDLSQHQLPVPHVGWNSLIHDNSSFYTEISADSSVYFVHSYHLITNPEIVNARVNYGIDLVASVNSNNIFGVQFHPEKSSEVGLSILRNFIKLAF